MVSVRSGDQSHMLSITVAITEWYLHFAAELAQEFKEFLEVTIYQISDRKKQM